MPHLGSRLHQPRGCFHQLPNLVQLASLDTGRGSDDLGLESPAPILPERESVDRGEAANAPQQIFQLLRRFFIFWKKLVRWSFSVWGADGSLGVSVRKVQYSSRIRQKLLCLPSPSMTCIILTRNSHYLGTGLPGVGFFLHKTLPHSSKFRLNHYLFRGRERT